MAGEDNKLRMVQRNVRKQIWKGMFDIHLGTSVKFTLIVKKEKKVMWGSHTVLFNQEL